METNAINTVYVLVHVIEETKSALDSTESGYVWEVYFKEDEARKEAENLNKKMSKEDNPTERGFYHKWIVLEKNIL